MKEKLKYNLGNQILFIEELCMKTKDLTLIGIFVALLSVIAPISIPLSGGIPISLATLMVMLIGVLLQDYKAVLVVSIYILLAIIGVPVLSGYGFGIQKVFGVTGGYILGYLPLAFISGLFSKYSDKYTGTKRYLYLLLGLLLGNIILYTIGTIWFINFTDTRLYAGLMACVIPFLPGDILKIVVVLLLEKRIRKLIK